MPSPIRQAAALPFRDGLLCMVTSRNGRRWVVPKGRIDPGHTATEAALVEAWEEAGLTGVLDGDAVGSFHYVKNGWDHHVTVFVMRVTQEATEYPERGLRTREWVTEDAALDRIDEHALRAIVRDVYRTGRATPDEALAAEFD
ncbi:MAG: NUDIX hydrolase [Fimbriiglobus sp.]